jgi:hypothetical protein
VPVAGAGVHQVAADDRVHDGLLNGGKKRGRQGKRA